MTNVLPLRASAIVMAQACEHRCSLCKRLDPPCGFNPARNRKRGVRYQCRDCANRSRRDWRARKRLAAEMLAPPPRELVPGDRFGRWTVVGPSANRFARCPCPCRCDCGTTRTVTRFNLLTGMSKSCGCLRSDLTRAARLGKPNRKELTAGVKYGRLTVLRFSHVAGRLAYWECACDCGTKRVVRGTVLTHGRIQSCGCAQREKAVIQGRILGQLSRRHGMYGSPTYVSWISMLGRARGTTDRRLYFDRGIRACAAWHKFENFFADMGERPTPKHSIDRIDNYGGYWCGKCPECVAAGRPANCRWATAKEQRANQRPRELSGAKGIQ